MENSNDDRMPIKKPRTWNPRDMYQEYAKFILANDPQCWGKYNPGASRKNYWIYKTIEVRGKPKIVEVMNYPRWKAIMTAYFDAAKERIIEGEGLSMGQLGMIRARRCERNHANRQVDFGATNKRPKVWDEKSQAMKPDITIFFTDDDYVLISWRKYTYYTNEKYYEFEPSNGDKQKDGFREQFSRANKVNPSLRFRYEYYPLVGYTRSQMQEDGIPVM